MTNRYPITREGYIKAKKELEILKIKDRKDVIKAIAEAREHGDLSENAEYNAARERQGFIEARISDMESIVSRAEVIDISKNENRDVVKFGATITIINQVTEERKTYKIVSDYEADINKGLISVNSPIIGHLLGNKVHHVFNLPTSKGEKIFRLVSISYI